MKFAKQLEAESVAEWRRAYINYKGLKKRLKAIEKHRRANAHAITAQMANANLLNDQTSSGMTTTSTSARFHPGRSSTMSWRPKRYNTTPSDLDDYRQERRDSFSRSILDRISATFFREDTELGNLSARPSVALEGSILDELLTHCSEPERYFFFMLDQELEKVSRFYNQKELEAKTKFKALNMQVELIQQYRRQLSEVKQPEEEPLEQRLNPMHWFHTQKPLNASTPSPTTIAIIPSGDHHMSYRVARGRLKTAITEYYRSLELLRSYKILNEMGFQKILKKFDKTAGWKASTAYNGKLKTYHWVQSNELDDIIKDTERLFVHEFMDGHRRRGMKKLRVPEPDGDYTTTTWRIGFCLGACIAIFARVIQLATDPQIQAQLPMLFYNLNIYGCILLPILFTLGFSINMAVWHRCHINYRFIFELNPRNCLDYHQFAEMPSFMLLLTSIVMYIDLSQCWAPAVPSQLCPLLLVATLLAILFCPFKLFYLSARQWLGVTLGRIALSGLLPVEFRDFFIADELNSMAFSIWMITYFFCVYSWHWNDLDNHCNVPKMWVTPLLACLPPLSRGLQCLRRYHDSKEVHHLVNGLKYVTSILATVFAGIRRISPSPGIEITWVLLSIINSTYTSIWDIKMDWGLLDVKSSHFLLRDDLVFYKWTYYTAIPLNIMLRFAWAINKASLAYHSEILAFGTAILEVFRRIVWNFFRLENEHLNNCGNYRAIKEIPLPFALKETYKMDPNEQEEGTIYLPPDQEETRSNNNSAVLPVITPDLSDTLVKPSDLVSSNVGSFYGRRDFETRQDKEDDHKLGLPVRQPSMVGQVLERIRTLGTPEESDSEIDDDDSDS